MFCASCGNLIIPKEGVMKCSCGYVEKEGKLVDKKKKETKVEVAKGVSDESLPKIKADCKNCGHNEAYFWTMQTRSADEPETRFFKCVKCSRVWREY